MRGNLVEETITERIVEKIVCHTKNNRIIIFDQLIRNVPQSGAFLLNSKALYIHASLHSYLLNANIYTSSIYFMNILNIIESLLEAKSWRGVFREHFCIF